VSRIHREGSVRSSAPSMADAPRGPDAQHMLRMPLARWGRPMLRRGGDRPEPTAWSMDLTRVAGREPCGLRRDTAGERSI